MLRKVRLLMAKIIKMDEAKIQELAQEFAEALRKLKLADGKFTFSKEFGKVEQKARLVFTEIAWLKQCMLVNEFDKEVAWHGIAKRGENQFEYMIEDILVYPQEVTGNTVNTDQQKYQDWLFDHPDDVFNNIRMQGHSHVNMSVTPSSVDLTLYDGWLSQLDDTMFYIFLIINKKGDRTIKIYDMAENILFETADVDVEVLDEGYGFSDFIDNAKEMVTTKTYQYQGSSYKPTNPPATTKNTAPPSTQNKAESQAPKNSSPSENNMKGKKKKNYYDNWADRWEDDDYYYGRWR